MLLIFVAYFNYLVDVYLMFAASAIAVNTVIRSIGGAAAPLFTRQMFSAMGVGGGGSLIAGVGVLLSVIPFLFYKYGAQLRARSKFSPTGMKKPAAAEHEPKVLSPPVASSDDESAGHHASSSENHTDSEGSRFGREEV